MTSFRLLAALLLLAAAPAAAQPARSRAPAPATAPGPAPAPSPAPGAAVTVPVPSTPQQTTASFGDWTLRCTHPTPDTRFCELVQGVQRDDRPVAQMALGRPAKGQPLQLTVLVPPSVTFGGSAALLPGRDGEAALAELTWRRCLPAGCIADAALPDDAVRRLRGLAEQGRITFADGAGRPAALPFSPRGLPQALDALAKEDAP